jgi:phosphate-selective porin
MNRPFGFEIQQSSQDRETPERARFTQVLLPNERDLGAMITFQPVKGKKLYGLKVDAGFYNGTGIAVPGTTSLNGAGVVDFDSYKDFIGRAHYKKSWNQDKVTLGIGVSHYNGGVVYQSNKVYSNLATDSLGVVSWQLSDTTNGTTFKGGKAPRIYYGGDLQFSVKSKLGTTSIRGEYITGTQSGTVDENKSPNSLPTKPDAVVRNFNGGYAYLIQRIGKTKHELALKYEWYDPNTKVTGADLVGTNGMTKAELKYTMLGVGYNYYMNDNVKFMVYYNMVTNENAKALTGYTTDLKDDVLTFRMQFRF